MHPSVRQFKTANPLNLIMTGMLFVRSVLAFLALPVMVGIYGSGVAIAVHLRVKLYEEPRLVRDFPEDWVRYSAKVARWNPFRRPAPPR